MIDKNNYEVGESLGGDLDFYTFRTTLDITRGDYNSDNQKRLNRLIQTICTRAQPIISNIGQPVVVTDSEYFPEQQGEVTVYSLKFSIEHALAWETTPTLLDELNGIEGFDYTNMHLTYHASL